MQKITILISGFLLFFFSVVMLAFSAKTNEKTSSLLNSVDHSPSEIQDRNLIKGNWQKDGSAVELHISRLRDNGLLEVNYLNSKFIFIEKAGWTNSSDVLRLFVVYRQDDSPGYSLSLNYEAEKDLLVGAYVDGSNNKTYNVTFKRIK
ncbi:hypothetical protein [Flavobacterium taihuense]|uniref:Lipoprotein n=1 Tax=Flavobacterium taihuense TaxID=2857508 RepID=A0ABS6XWV4_9FLAO|nr:hypothetical protein [Flavobacterium taihuense]MBW4361154.1 hypothetical protein [Flavobacterium taihuense]